MTAEQRKIMTDLVPKLAAIAYNELQDNTVMCNFTDVELEAIVSFHKSGIYYPPFAKWVPYVEAEMSKRKAEYRDNQIDNLLDDNHK